jgi:hypothetical protein
MPCGIGGTTTTDVVSACRGNDRRRRRGRAEHQIRRMFDAGVTELVAMLLGGEDEQARSTVLLADLAGRDQPDFFPPR